MACSSSKGKKKSDSSSGDVPFATCNICYMSFNRSSRVPKILVCGHTFCSSCIRQQSSLCVSIACASCRTQSTGSHRKCATNFQLLDILEFLGCLDVDEVNRVENVSRGQTLSTQVGAQEEEMPGHQAAAALIEIENSLEDMESALNDTRNHRHAYLFDLEYHEDSLQCLLDQAVDLHRQIDTLQENVNAYRLEYDDAAVELNAVVTDDNVSDFHDDLSTQDDELSIFNENDELSIFNENDDDHEEDDGLYFDHLELRNGRFGEYAHCDLCDCNLPGKSLNTQRMHVQGRRHRNNEERLTGSDSLLNGASRWS